MNKYLNKTIEQKAKGRYVPTWVEWSEMTDYEIARVLGTFKEHKRRFRKHQSNRNNDANDVDD
jgi:predicted Fe-S protein YdhL (DUF1289 family)